MIGQKTNRNWDWFNYYWITQVVNVKKIKVEYFTYEEAVYELASGYGAADPNTFILNYRVTKSKIIKELFKE